MTEDQTNYQPPPPAGDNKPPEPIDDAFEAMGVRTLELVDTANRWIKERPTITDEKTAGKAQDFINQLNAEKRAVEDHRKQANRPLQDQITANNQAHQRLDDQLGIAVNALVEKREAWLDQERERRRTEEQAARIAAEEAGRRAEELAAKAASETVENPVQAQAEAIEAQKLAKVADQHASRIARAPVMAKGAIGSGSSGKRGKWAGRINDWDQAWLRFGADEKVRKVLQQVVDAEIRKAKGNITLIGIEVVRE